MMKPAEIIKIPTEHRERAIQTIIVSFTTDPFIRWLWSDPGAYLHTGPGLDAFGGRSLEQGTAYATADYGGIAMWLPPGIQPDEGRFDAYLEKTVPASVMKDAEAVFEAMDQYHPENDCWYLPVIGVDPIYRGRGYGTSLMKHALDIIDKDGKSAYLETANPDNVIWYGHLGFESLGEIQVGSSPKITPMLRKASQATP